MSLYFNRKVRVQKLIEYFGEREELVGTEKKRFRNGIEKAREMLEEVCRQGIKEFEELENGIAELKNKAHMAQFAVNLDLTDHICQLIGEEDYNKFAARVQELNFYSISSQFEALEHSLSSLISIKNLIPYYSEKKHQIELYYNERQGSMPEGIKSLYQKVLEGRALTQKRISTIENYERLAQDLAMILRYFTALTSLDLSENHMKPAGARLLASAIRDSHNLLDLSLGGNEILDEGCEFICECIPSLPKLESLFLYKNCLTAKSALRLSQVLPCASSLKLISLNQNTIGDEGLGYLCGVLKALPNLEAIGLQKNQITAKSSQNIARILVELPKLADFSLDDNCIGDAGANELIKTFPLVKGNLKLYVRFNDISEELENKLKISGGQNIAVAISYKVY